MTGTQWEVLFTQRDSDNMIRSSNGNIFRVTGPLYMGGIHWSLVNSFHKGQRGGALMFSLICTWTNGWADNQDAGDLRCYCIHYDATVMRNTCMGVIVMVAKTMKLRQNGRHFADDIFKCIFLTENVSMPIEMSLKSVPKGRINNIPALVQIMAWRSPGDKPLSEPMMVLASMC